MAYVHVSKDTHRKLDFNTRECRLVGYGGTNQWRAWDEEKEDVVVSRDVIFDEQPIFTESEVAEIEVEPPTENKPKVYNKIVVQPPPRRQRSPAPQESELEPEEMETELDDLESEEGKQMSTMSTIPLNPASKS